MVSFWGVFFIYFVLAVLFFRSFLVRCYLFECFNLLIPCDTFTVFLTRGRESVVDDIKIIYNDWPYGIDKSIVHLCVWTKFPLDADEKDPNGDLTPEMRAKIDEYVNKTFGSRVPAENVSRLSPG